MIMILTIAILIVAAMAFCTLILMQHESNKQENEEIIVKNRVIKRESEIYAENMIKLNKELEDKNLECTYLAAENNDLKGKLENSISKDTIREKITELENRSKLYDENNYKDIEMINILSNVRITLEQLINNN